MAIEPGTSSLHYDPKIAYTAPVGRVPILGKARAEVDRIRAAAWNDLNQIINRDLAQVLNNTKVTAELAALAAQTTDNTRKVDSVITNDGLRVINETNRSVAEVDGIVAATANEIIKTTNDTTRTTNDTTKTTAEVAALNTRVIDETRKIDAELTALLAQTVNEDQKTVNDVQRTANDTTRANNDSDRKTGELEALDSKTTAEVALLSQKTETELAQVADAVPSANPVVGIIGKQKVLFGKQAAGFDRDAEQKLAKIFADTWSVRQTTDGNLTATTAGLGDPDVASILTTAKNGLGQPAS